MTPTFACKKGGKRYRHYACVNALKRGRQVCPCRYVPALAIERVVVEQIREFAKSKHQSVFRPTAAGRFCSGDFSDRLWFSQIGLQQEMERPCISRCFHFSIHSRIW
jgi:hypothetical protein